jgi:hypothetical protein
LAHSHAGVRHDEGGPTGSGAARREPCHEGLLIEVSATAMAWGW